MSEPSAIKVTGAYAPPPKTLTVWVWVTKFESSYHPAGVHPSEELAMRYKPKSQVQALESQLYEVVLPLAPFGGGY